MVRGVTGAFNLIIEERDRDLHMNTRAIACFAIGINRTAVPNSLQRINPLLHNITRRRTINRHHKTHTTRRMFIIVLVKAIFSHPLTLGFLGCDPGFVICCHGISFPGGAIAGMDLLFNA